MHQRIVWTAIYSLAVQAYSHGYLAFAGVYAFVIVKDDVTESEEEIVNGLQKIVRAQIGGFAVPESFLVSLYISLYLGCIIIIRSVQSTNVSRLHCAFLES